MSGTKKGAPKGGAKSGGKSAGGGRGAAPPTKAESRAARGEVTYAVAAEVSAGTGEMPRMQQRYVEEIRAAMLGEFGYTNPMQVPKLEKIVINMGVGEAAGDQKKLDAAVSDRLVTIALPRVRDFRGIPGTKGFDGRGNFAMGLKEQIVFPEIVYDKVDEIRGMDIVFVTTAKTDAEAKSLLKKFDIPFSG